MLRNILILFILIFAGCGSRVVLVRNPYMPVNTYNIDPKNFGAYPYIYFPVIVDDPIIIKDSGGIPAFYDFTKMEPVIIE